MLGQNVVGFLVLSNIRRRCETFIAASRRSRDAEYLSTLWMGWHIIYCLNLDNFASGNAFC